MTRERGIRVRSKPTRRPRQLRRPSPVSRQPTVLHLIRLRAARSLNPWKSRVSKRISHRADAPNLAPSPLVPVRVLFRRLSRANQSNRASPLRRTTPRCRRTRPHRVTRTNSRSQRRSWNRRSRPVNRKRRCRPTSRPIRPATAVPAETRPSATYLSETCPVKMSPATMRRVAICYEHRFRPASGSLAIRSAAAPAVLRRLPRREPGLLGRKLNSSRDNPRRRSRASPSPRRP